MRHWCEVAKAMDKCTVFPKEMRRSMMGRGEYSNFKDRYHLQDFFFFFFYLHYENINFLKTRRNYFVVIYKDVTLINLLHMLEYICHRNNDIYVLFAFTRLLHCRHTPNNRLTIVIIAQEAGLFGHVIYSCILKILYKPNVIFQVL